jgi:SAM-dependent methyltransferase
VKEADLQQEAQFFDRAYQSGTREPVGQFYDVLQSSTRYLEGLLVSHAAGKEVLECGTGTGDYSLFLGEHGARVVGIDVSPAAIELARKRALSRGLDAVSFMVMDVQRMDFEENSFDLVCGAGILHHLDLRVAIAEILRVLRPEGKVIFREPLGHNPAINLFRRLTPHLRSPGEHPLTMSDLLVIQKAFRRSDCRFFHLLSVPFAPLAKRPGLSHLAQVLDHFDSLLLQRLPWGARFAWQVVMLMESPNKASVMFPGSPCP